jgi:hypothetical protein
MAMVRRRTFLVAAASAVGAIALAGAPAAAQRGAWLASVRGASSPAALGVAILRLEGAMGWSSVQNSWRAARTPWLARVSAI